MNKQVYYVNSRDRISGTDSNFLIKLNIDGNKEFDRIVILDLSIPKSMYNINSYNNTFIVKNEDELDGERIITIPHGNYNRKTFVSTLTNLLNTLQPSGWSYSISYSSSSQPDTAKFTFTITGNSGIQPSFKFSNNNSLFEIMGFNPNSINSFQSSSLISENVINFNTEGTYYLHSDMCQDQNNILTSIYTGQTEQQSYIIYHNDTPLLNSKIFVNKNADLFNFFLTNEDDLPINLNGLNIVFTLLLYKEDFTNQIISSYIKLKILKD